LWSRRSTAIMNDCAVGHNSRPRWPGQDIMTPLETLILGSYFFILVILGVYGWHRYYLVYAYMKNKDRVPGPPPAWDGPMPRVTIQLPIYNEMYVIDRRR
jgi:cellulose synthase/poly-beta-1,6-N-acetylglucosamine synthase-like glycosyltransferase